MAYLSQSVENTRRYPAHLMRGGNAALAWPRVSASLPFGRASGDEDKIASRDST
jgi:hypothetical protein